jgi:hypothetical protein
VRAVAGRFPASLTLPELRRQLLELNVLAGAAELPKPSVVNGPRHPMPGPDWHVGGRPDRPAWSVRVVDGDDVAQVIYLNTPGHMDGDYTATQTTEARQFALAVLAACDRADHEAAGIPQLADRRSRKRPQEGDRVT